MPRRTLARESVRTIDHGEVTVIRHGGHLYTIRLSAGQLDADLIVTTDQLANIADAMLVLSEHDRAERSRQRKGVSSMT